MNPYKSLPKQAFWKLAVSNRSMFDLNDIWDPKFPIYKKSKVVTFGSCFAQHIGKALAKNGFSWLDTELPPNGLSIENSKKYNYNVFSARTGNIYTTSLLKQWVQWAVDGKSVPEEVWECSDRFFDPFRPSIEYGGFSSVDELFESRWQAIKSFELAIKECDVFVFTLGLTESWFDIDGFEYPVCPGTVSGVFDSKKHVFLNQDFNFVKTNLIKSINLIRQVNPKVKFLLTVSPVPLVATNSGSNVLVATMHSKSILRSVAGQISRNHDFVDYFPSYEIINSPVFRGAFFEPNMRGVNQYGVNFVMSTFFNGLNKKYLLSNATYNSGLFNNTANSYDIVCEEEVLAAFGGEG